MVLKVGLLGASGRMGQGLRSFLEKDPEAEPVFCQPRDAEKVFQKSHVVVDFSVPEATLEHLSLAVFYKKPLLVGVTGLGKAHEKAIVQAAQEIPLLWMPNTSFGVLLLERLVREAASFLAEDYDAEIFESHHRHKADAPSGTAFLLGNALAEGRGVLLEEKGVFGRTPSSPKRQKGEIGFSIQRGGSQGFEHSVRFIGDEEELVLSHRGFSRDLFVKGAIKAAKWLKEQPKGLYRRPE